MGQKSKNKGKTPKLYVLPNAASGAGSAMAAPLTRVAAPKAPPPQASTNAEPTPIPAVGLDAAKKAARARNRDEKRVTESPEPLKTGPNNTENHFNEEIDMNDTTQKFEKLTAEAAAHQQEQLEAVIKSGNLFLAGTQDLLKTYAGLAQQSVEKNSEAVKTLLGCKTLNELTETQTRLAQESFEGFINNATKLSELSVKLATESFEPLNAQLNKTVKKASEAAAA